MSNTTFVFIWRCARCTSHFANINKTEGLLQQEKKCPKCKSLNILTLNNKEIHIHCKLYDPNLNGYNSEEFEESYPPVGAGV